jgi:hypothetical protein
MAGTVAAGSAEGVASAGAFVAGGDDACSAGSTARGIVGADPSGAGFSGDVDWIAGAGGVTGSGPARGAVGGGAGVPLGRIFGMIGAGFGETGGGVGSAKTGGPMELSCSIVAPAMRVS